MGSDDVKLVYTDDDPDSYSNIFNNAKTKVSKKDQKRLIESLRKLNEGENVDEVVNTDEVIRYLFKKAKRMDRSHFGSLPKLESFQREEIDRLD